MQMSMKKSKSIDLTSSPILKTLSELALPIMASSLLGTAYNITDMAWIGLLGSKAVAGVGVGGMYVWLSQGLVALPESADRCKHCTVLRQEESIKKPFLRSQCPADDHSVRPLICCSKHHISRSADRIF